MANRFNDQYRPPHSGDSVFPQKITKTPSQYQEDAWTQPRISKGTDYGPRKDNDENPHSAPKKAPRDQFEPGPHEYKQRKTPPNYNERPKKGDSDGPKKGDPYKDHYDPYHNPDGGSSVSRKPKTPSKSPSGGVALPIPQKV
jgi:hypothetical protein